MRFLKYFILLFVVILAIFAVALAAIYRDVKQQAIQELNTRQMVHARQASQGIQNHLEYIVSTLDLLARLAPIIAMDNDGRKIMSEYQAMHSDEVKGVTRVDATGRIIYTVPQTGDAIGRDISFQEHVREVLKTHRVVISDVFMAVQGFRTIAVHVPVVRNGAFAGSLAFLLSFDTIAQRHIENIRIGKSGYAWVVSQKGFEISCPLPGHVGRSVYDTGRDYPEVIAMADEMLKGREGVATYHYDQNLEARPATVLKHAVYMPIRIGNTFWSIVIATPEDEVLASMSGFRSKFLLITLALLVFSSIFTYYPRPHADHHPRTEKARTHREGSPGERRVLPADIRRLIRPDPVAEGQCLQRVQPGRPDAVGQYPARRPHPLHAGGHLPAPAARRLAVRRSSGGEDPRGAPGRVPAL